MKKMMMVILSVCFFVGFFSALPVVARDVGLNKGVVDPVVKPRDDVVAHQQGHPEKPALLSLNFQKIAVRRALQMLGQFAKLNIVISDQVKGEMSLHIKNLTWQSALKTILLTQDLGKRQMGSVLFIAPVTQIAKYEQDAMKATLLIPLKTRLIHLNYAKAQEMAHLLRNKDQGLLSQRGAISVDQRTNSLVIKEIPATLSKLTTLIHQLDIPVKQVMIAAKIINIDSDYEKELGIRFGISSPSHLSGTLAAANALAGHKGAASIDPTQRLNVDLPAIAKDAGRMSLALFKLAPGVLLDLELSALESEGHAEIISSPQLITANQQPAVIQAGQEIPYQEKTYSGATSVTFKKAVLSLKVVPQIIPDGRVVLHLKVNQDKRSSKEVQGVPAIDTRYIQTQILVKNGQTVVLGGIFEETHTNMVDRVPFFARIPLIGALFRHVKQVSSRRELLIFITPKVMEK